LVRVHRIGICGTDLHAFGGRQPFFTFPRVLGHELGVEVLEIGPGVAHVRVGDRCSVEPYLNCQSCIACRRGKPNCCTALKVLGVHVDGGMRDHLLVPARKLHPSAHLSYDKLALVETLAIGCHAVARAGIEAGETVLVIGAGPIGLSVLPFAAAAGARVVVLDVNPRRLAFCRALPGVVGAIDPGQESVPDALRALGAGDLPTAVFDATGNPRSMMDALDLPAAGGRIVFVGLFPGDVTFNDPSFHRRELTLLATRNALPGDFSRIVGLIESGQIDTQPWITHRSTLAAVPADFPAWTQPAAGVIKAMVAV
jgi:2-desacetyl-2-hydroxyethyl bacteriochlorophyllide A dehydrogenase